MKNILFLLFNQSSERIGYKILTGISKEKLSYPSLCVNLTTIFVKFEGPLWIYKLLRLKTLCICSVFYPKDLRPCC